MLPPTFPRSLLIAGHGTNHHSSLFELTPFSWVTALSAVTATAVLTTYKRWWFPAVRDYGWRGVLSRYIREEDPHRAPIQERQQILQLIATDLDKKEKSLRNLEEGLQQASIHSIQGAHRRISRSVWEQYVPVGDLQKKRTWGCSVMTWIGWQLKLIR
ncbi:hypothetical protein FisN_25Hu191 [Fistulifera solaris]|uniref:Uncharacterized protein n=1 Tax=Fistulifera solaris TaxID=1519565 RepID=A0A1Z5JVZ3_FISSO|nr:hypothetical protein FisN_25Hu191 [Fistulifera solaris]|eukprot:GAX18207.1 hypothetical protein FisN_25Hu191 [Fistulifera solaris]